MDAPYVPAGNVLHSPALEENAHSLSNKITTHEALLLRSGFTRQVNNCPNQAALIIRDRIYSYGEIDDIARRWAGNLIYSAREPIKRIGVFARRNETSYVGVLASLFAGAGFVPFSPKSPMERNRAMFQSADVDAVFVDEQSLPQFMQFFPSLPRLPKVLLPETNRRTVPIALPPSFVTRDELNATLPLKLFPSVNFSDLAYLLFTSGSSGVPKGVPITNANISAFLAVNTARYNLTSRDRLTQIFEQTFDLSIFDLFMAWESGACVCSMSSADMLTPCEYLERHKVTVWFSVPSMISLMFKRGQLFPNSMPTLRWSLFCGEGLPCAMAERWQLAAPNSIVENLYGPTELTVACAVHTWKSSKTPNERAGALVPIGEVYPTLKSLIVDETLTEVFPSNIGELCVAGPQTTKGYWKAPELMSISFFERADLAGNILRYYRTGDLVRRVAGELTYLGRCDQQIKLNGFRIELGDVEAGLRQAGALEAVALSWSIEDQMVYLVAVVSGSTDLGALKALSSKILPSYMIPKFFFYRNEMPLTLNGKIDRNAVREWLVCHFHDQVGGEPDRNVIAPLSTVDEIDALIASVLRIEPDRIKPDLAYQTIPEWDSLQHVQLILALENCLRKTIDQNEAARLKTVKSIREIALSCSDRGGNSDSPVTARIKAHPQSQPTIHRGLAGVHIDDTAITHIDGAHGVLEHCGYGIQDLLENSSFEETAMLLIEGQLPDCDSLVRFKEALRSHACIPPVVVTLVRSLACAQPLDVLRTAVSALGALQRDNKSDPLHSILESGAKLIAQVPTIIAIHHSIRHGRDPLPPAENLSHAANLLYMLTGRQPSPQEAQMIDQDLILHADHGSNASTFSARVTIGCRADIHAAVTAALATFSGKLHGGAAEQVLDVIDEIATPGNAASYVRKCLDNNQPIMGFGHRVYRTEDPRSGHSRKIAERLSREKGDMHGFHIIDSLCEAMKSHSRHGICPNVDLYTGLSYRLMGLSNDLASVIFVAGRIAGWIAHAIEQQRNNILIRPLMRYLGADSRQYVPIHARPNNVFQSVSKEL